MNEEVQARLREKFVREYLEPQILSNLMAQLGYDIPAVSAKWRQTPEFPHKISCARCGRVAYASEAKPDTDLICPDCIPQWWEGS